MLKTRCVKIKLKPGMVERAREWAAEINRRKDEAYSVLRRETVVFECAFLDSHEGGDFLIYFMKAKSFDVFLPQDESAASISSFHQAFKRDAWESGAPCLVCSISIYPTSCTPDSSGQAARRSIVPVIPRASNLRRAESLACMTPR